MNKPIREVLKACLERRDSPKPEAGSVAEGARVLVSAPVSEEILLLRSIAADVKRVADVLTEWNRRGIPTDRL